MGQLNTPIDTIVAIATPFGEGGLGVVRLSGPQAISLTQKIFRSKSSFLDAPSHTLHHGWIQDDKTILDEAVVGLFRAPTSYTGDDVVELSCHGSPSVLKNVVELCVKNGARLAKPGEYTERAYLNGKIDLTQAEAVADLIASRSDKARRAATVQLEGGLRREIQLLRQPLVELLAHLEANLDFVEEDIPPLSKKSTQEKLKEMSGKIEKLIQTHLVGRLLREGIHVAIAGRPNVGKSSLFNSLLARDRAIVTEIPGTTRDTIEEMVQWDGYPVVLIDTAGLRSSEDPVEKMGHERARQSLSRSDVQIFVLNGAEPLSKDDFALLSGRDPARTVVAVNKSDCPQQWKPSDHRELNRFPIAFTSAKLKTGLKPLQSQILSCLKVDGNESEDGQVVVNERHKQLLESALLKLQSAERALQEKKSEESIGWDIKEAARALDGILGTDINEDVLDSIFRAFCIGK